MTPAMMILGWERFTMLRFTQAEDAARLLSRSNHLLTPDGLRFAPVRLLRDLALGMPVPESEQDCMPFVKMRPGLEQMGWKALRAGDEGYDKAAAAWVADAQSLSSSATVTEQVFIVAG